MNKKLGEERAPDRPACRRRKDLGLFAAACHSRRHTPDRRRRTPFFFAASKGNHGRERIAEDTMNVRSRYKTREPVEVVQQLESCHHESVTDFPLIEKSVFPEKYSDFRSKKGKNHPLKKAKSHCEDAGNYIEVCDVLTTERDFVHIKRKDGGSSDLSHLFNQGRNSALALIRDAQYRERARGHLKDFGPNAIKRIPKDKPRPGSFRVVYGIIGDFPGKIVDSLPFFSQISLMDAAQKLAERGIEVCLCPIS